MHIPSGESQTVALLSFEEALARGGEGDSYDREKWLYVPDFYTEYRYVLGTKGKNPLICIGINPSTARPDCLDNTLKSVERIAHCNGFDSFLMFNVYAQRATDPDDMDSGLNLSLHEENMKAFSYLLNQIDRDYTPTVWAAWGTIIEKRPYLRYCVEDMIRIGQKFGARWVCAGNCSKKGHPHHPLYLRKDSVIRDFNITEYTDTL